MDYIKHQLDIAKSKGPIFDDKCYPLIHTLTSGIPRRINQLCYNTLLHSYFDKKPIITDDYVKYIYGKLPHIIDKPLMTDINARHAVNG